MTKHRSHGAAFKRQVTWGLIPKAPLIDSWKGFPSGEISDSWRGEIRAILSAVRLREDYSAEELRTQPVEGRQSEPSSSVAGCGSRWNGPGGGGEDWQHGSPEAARLGSSLQRFRTSSTTARKGSNGMGGRPSRFGNAVAYPFFHSPTFCRHSKVAVSGRGTSTVVRNCKDVSPTGDDYAEERTQRGCRAS